MLKCIFKAYIVIGTKRGHDTSVLYKMAGLARPGLSHISDDLSALGRVLFVNFELDIHLGQVTQLYSR